MIILIAAGACLLFAAALGLLAWDKRRSETEALNQHLQKTVDKQITSFRLSEIGQIEAAYIAKDPSAKPNDLQQKIAQTLRFKTWAVSRQAAMALMGITAVIVVVGMLRGGVLMALALLVVWGLLVVFGLWRRLEKKKQKMLSQLPGFLDNVVRLITIGNSPQAAFQMAIPSVPEPLGEALEQASSVVSAHSNLSYAMEVLEKTWRMPEFGLLAAVFRMSVKYGGRTDLVLERVSAYIRDKQSAERELHAMSAEVRLSAWILSLLPIVVGTLIMVLNDGYFMRMWNDASGRNMIAMAAGLELVGVALLYRLAKLR